VYPQGFRRLLLRHPAEEPALDDAREAFVQLRELVECLVQLEQRFGGLAGARCHIVIERHM
jgi:hypothetical protein